MAIPQIVASAGAINLFIVGFVCIYLSKNHSGSSWRLDDDELESKVLAPVTWGKRVVDSGKLVNRVRDASSSYIVTSKSIIFKCCNEDQIK